jgi:hypothetical protein
MNKQEMVDKVHAQMLVDRAKLALEDTLPRQVAYVVLLSGPDFGTFGSNMDKYQSLLALRGLVKALEADCARGGG